MARELRPIDASDHPDLRRIAEEVHTTGEPRVLQRSGEDLAVVVRSGSPRARAPRAARGRRFSMDDALFNIVGIADSSDPDEPTDVSSDKHRYLADAYASHAE